MIVSSGESCKSARSSSSSILSALLFTLADLGDFANLSCVFFVDFGLDFTSSSVVMNSTSSSSAIKSLSIILGVFRGVRILMGSSSEYSSLNRFLEGWTLEVGRRIREGTAARIPSSSPLVSGEPRSDKPFDVSCTSSLRWFLLPLRNVELRGIGGPSIVADWREGASISTQRASDSS